MSYLNTSTRRRSGGSKRRFGGSRRRFGGSRRRFGGSRRRFGGSRRRGGADPNDPETLYGLGFGVKQLGDDPIVTGTRVHGKKEKK